MSRSASLIYCEHPASADDLAKFKRAIEYTQGRLTYKRIKGGYHCFCYRCGQHYDLTDEQMQQTKEAGLCFKCAYQVKPVQKRSKKIYPKWSWLSICNEKGAENGYHVVWEGEEDNIRILYATHVLHYDTHGAKYIYGIVKNMGYSLCRTDSKNYWRKEGRSYNDYITYFWNVNEIMASEGLRKKDFYTALNLELKSNQATFVKNGIYNENQLAYIQLFDLNYPEELHKYKDYIARHRVPEHSEKVKLSVNTLEYLVRNNLPIGEFMDYVRACKMLGIKWEKPKNLYEKHDELIKMLEIRKNEAYAEKVKERHEQLAGNEWHKGSLAIHVFKSIQDMQNVSEKLSNCISRLYVKPYCEETTDVYYGTAENETTFALEIANRKLQQLRGPCNHTVNDDVKKFVKEWCKRLGYQY